MKNNSLLIFSLILFACLCSASAFAQENDRRAISAASSLYVISANAGGVNFVEGEVAVTRKAAKSGYLLKGDALQIGDKVATGANSKAEILLNPGSFVRLAENSNFEFVTTSLDDLQLKLNAGSAMFEVITTAEFSFAVATPKAVFHIVKSGIYRVDTAIDGTSKIEVWKGAAKAGDQEIKSGRHAVVGSNGTTVAKFDRDEKDALEIWSKTRAKELAKINARLQNTATRNSLMRSYAHTGWNFYNSYGLWVYNPMFGSYCFLPFGYGWNSPYGHYYRRDIWQYRLPPVIFSPPPTVVPTRGGVATGAAVANPKIRNVPVDGENNPIRSVPPYRRLQKDIGSFPTDSQTDGLSSPPVRMSPSRMESNTVSPMRAEPVRSSDGSAPLGKSRGN